MIQEVWQIAPKPKKKFEIRLIIWEVIDVPREAFDVEDCVDLYIKGNCRSQI